MTLSKNTRSPNVLFGSDKYVGDMSAVCDLWPSLKVCLMSLFLPAEKGLASESPFGAHDLPTYSERSCILGPITARLRFSVSVHPFCN